MRCTGRLRQIAAELRDGSFPFADGDEDIHMAIERRVGEIAGRVGGRLHTARSRNDQVATDVAMFVRERALTRPPLPLELAQELVKVARAHLDWPMPGTRICSGRSRSTSATICSPMSGCCCVTSDGSSR